MNIKQLREQLGLTQREFAARLSTTVTTVSRWERGEAKPNLMARALIERLKEEANLDKH